MALANVHKRKPALPWKAGVVLLIVLVTCFVLSFVLVDRAQGSGETDPSTIGVGSTQASISDSAVSAKDRIVTSSSSSTISNVSETVAPTTTAQRSITVKDPDPVIVPVAVDESNPTAVEKAKTVCTLSPLPTAPRVAPDVNDGTWQTGVASAYDVETNDDGLGNFGVNVTASGIKLHDNSITVAVPASKAYLLGRIVEICYDGKVVIATVTDTGGFEGYGRALDLAPGVFKALGAPTSYDWGTRTVSYRYL